MLLKDRKKSVARAATKCKQQDGGSRENQQVCEQCDTNLTRKKNAVSMQCSICLEVYCGACIELSEEDFKTVQTKLG